jgi:hypothetical protein
VKNDLSFYHSVSDTEDVHTAQELDQPILIDEGVRYQTFLAIKIGLLASDNQANGLYSSSQR